MRPSAGNGLKRIGGVDFILNDNDEWIPSGKAREWERCSRCRKPVEHPLGTDRLCEWCDLKKRTD